MELTVQFAPDRPPLSVLAAAKVAGVQLSPDSGLPSGSDPCLIVNSGSKLHGTNEILRYLAGVASIPNFYGRDPLETGQIDSWLEYASIFSSGSEFENACILVDHNLSSRTFLVGYNVSIADIAIWSGLAGAGQRWQSLLKSKKHTNLARWYDSIVAEYGALLNDLMSAYVGKRGVGKSVNFRLKENDHSNGKDDTITNGISSEKEKGGGPFELELPGAKVGEVCLRFAPEPSGYLHIGHSKAALLNKYFAEKYKGKFILRFDDTNPSKENEEFVDNLLSDVETLGIKYDCVTHTSDYFPELMAKAEEMIKEGKAYVDDTPKMQMKEERMEGIESKCRNNTVEQNLALWKEIIAGTVRGFQCCLRGKLDMHAPNKSLRDPVYYRCNADPHHRLGSKYKAYPTYDFACPYVDSWEGVTHALRSSEYHDRNEQYYAILEHMDMRRVQIYEFSRLNMVNTLLSKRKLLWFVQEKKVDGWDDPRFPTVQGIIRRGLKVDALIEFIVQQGASKNINLMEWDKLWTINKKMIDPVCPRHTAVLAEHRVMLTLLNGPEKPEVRILSRHKKYDGAGTKATLFTSRIWLEYADAISISTGEEITLMDWGNAIIKEIDKDEDGKVTRLTGVLHLEGSFKTTKLKLTWLPESDELINLSLVELDHLITKKKLEEDEDFKDVLNPITKREIPALGDSNIRNLQRGEILQLERKGYFRCDVPFFRPSKPVILIAIPDGRKQASTK